jgi:hypothetical protein
MKRSTLLKLLVIPALAVFVPMVTPKPIQALSCWCNTTQDCKNCFHTQEPIACGIVSPHVCTWL